mgnify:CR=1 FL=1
MKKRILSLLLALALVLTGVPMAFATESGFADGNVPEISTDGPVQLPSSNIAEDPTVETDAQQPVEAGEPKLVQNGEDRFSTQLAESEPKADEVVTFIVVMQKSPLLVAGFTKDDIATRAPKAVAYEAALRLELNALKANLTQKFRNDAQFELGYTYTIATTGVAVKTEYGNKEALEALPGVDHVYVAPTFSLPEEESALTSDGELQPMTSNATTMIGADQLNATGFTGKGMKVAILDTGIVVDHPNFGALSEDKLTESSLTKEGVDAIWNTLNAGQMTSLRNRSYYNSKLPFIFNYYTHDFDVSHATAKHDHGTHVAGITAANKIEGSSVIGVAPDAQIIVMQVFSAGGGAGWDTIMAGLEDCVRLDVDACNLSLGAAGGFTTGDMSKTLELFESTDIEVLIAAGNETNAAYQNRTGWNLSRSGNPDDGVVGTPSTLSAALSVASIDNDGAESLYFTVNGRTIGYNDTATTNATKFLSNFKGQSVEFVPIGGYGEASDYENVDVSGKIALVSRGSSSFPDKQAAAQAAGAIGIVVYNNASGMLNMQINDGGDNIPAVFVSKADGEYMKAQFAEGVKTLTCCNGDLVQVKRDRTLSDFSSWGVPGNLDLKPEITAPGGNIWSTLTDGTYGSMSGTSMSAPSVTGMAAVVAQYLRETGLAEQEGMTVRALSQALLMSTSSPLKQDNGVEYSPRKQGSGFANVYHAVTTPAYLLTDSKDVTDGKVKVNLGDDPDRTGEYTFDFTINNLSDKALAYVLHAGINTMAVEEIEGENYMSDTARVLSPKVTFDVEGGTSYLYDLNGDGAIDENDALVLLQVANGTHDALSEADTAKYDFDGDGALTTADAQLYLAGLHNEPESPNVYAAAVTVPASGSVSVKATVKLSEADRAYFAEYYPNGCYVEGFVYASDPTEAEAELSLPILAYYGSWTDASMFDKYITLRDSVDPDAVGYTTTQYANALVLRGSGSSSAYYLTANPYGQAAEFLADRTAISSTSGMQLYGAYASLIRNAGGDLNAVISNAETGEVYASVDQGVQFGAYYNTSAAAWGNNMIAIPLSWNVTDKNGGPLPEGTKIKVTVNAIPEYNWDRSTKTVKGTLGAGASWTTELTVDNTAPELTGASYTRDFVTGESSLRVTAKDNRYVAAILVTNARQTQVLARQAVDQTELGVESTVTVDTSGVTGSEVCVIAVDYAGNMAGYKIKLNGSEEEEIDADSFYANNAYDSSWIAFKAGSMDTAKTVAQGAIYAADCVEDHVFTIDSSARFCVAPLNDLENQTYIETLSLPSNALDMAYNYADGKLYVLCTQNRLYSIDPLMGTLEMVGTIPMSAGLSFMTLACATDGTFYAATYSDYNSRLYKFVLTDEGFTVTPFPKTTGMKVAFLQSMTYDHNTGKLYHANYGAKTYYTTFISYDLTTGEATVLDELYQAELCGLFIPRKSGSMFGPSEKVQEISLSQESLDLIKGSSATLEVSAKPWTVVNRDCTWTSSDETVAKVENGVVKAVGAGTCTIKAASVLDPSVTDTCTVTVKEVDHDLSAVIWDADSQSWFSTFNTKTIPNYKKLTEQASRQQIMAAATDTAGITYAASYEEKDGNLYSTLYQVGKDYSLTKIGDSEVAYTDMTFAEKLNGGTMLATCGKSIVTVDTATGAYTAGWNLSTLFSANLVGITYLNTVNDTTNGVTDNCLVLDADGKVWAMGFYGDGDNLHCTLPQLVADLGITASRAFFCSIATDGAYLYATILNGSQSELAVLDLKTGAAADLGSFNADVWPVVGLRTGRVTIVTSASTSSAMESTDSLPALQEAQIEALPVTAR